MLLVLVFLLMTRQIDPWTFRWESPNERWPHGAWVLRFCPSACVSDVYLLDQCVAGPGMMRNLVGCARFDLDHDGDVDLMDYGIVQLLWRPF